MNEKLENRLYNFKFGQALDYLEGEDNTTRGVVEALAEMFDDPGWFHGHMATIVMAACRSIGVTFDEDNQREPDAIAKALVAAFVPPDDEPVHPTSSQTIDGGPENGNITMTIYKFDTPGRVWAIPSQLTGMVEFFDGDGHHMLPSMESGPDGTKAWFPEPRTGRCRVLL